MRHLRTLLTLALLPTLTSIGLTQPPSPPPGRFRIPPSVTLYSLLYLKDSGLRRELKITDEQARKLEPLVHSASKAIADAEDAGRRGAAIKTQDEALAAILSPPQVGRLRQVVCQHLARVPAGPAALASDEVVVRELKLDEDQKKRLLARTRLEDVLTAEQQKAWTTVVGKPYPARLRLAPYTPLTYYSPTQVLMYLEEPVQQELKLTDKQIDQIDKALDRWVDEFPDISIQRADVITKQLVKEVRGHLTPAQLKRGEQILLQRALQNTTTLGKYEDPRVAKVLNLTEEQKEGQFKARRDHVLAALKLFSAGGDSHALRDKVSERRKGFADRLERELTDKQRADLKELLGEPIGPKLFPGYVPHLPWARREPQPPTYLVFKMLENRGQVHFFGPVTAEQAKRLAEIKSDRPVDEDEAGLKARAKAVEKRLATIFTPEQIRKWRQLTLRWLATAAGGIGWESEPVLLSCVDVASEISLSEEQRKRFYRGAQFLDLLDARQRAKWDAMVGPPEKPAPVVSTGAPLFHSMSILWIEMRIIGDPAMAVELKLTDKQKTDLAKWCKDRRDSFPKGTAMGDYQAMEKHIRESAAGVGKILTEEQRRRLRQVTLQSQGGRKRIGAWVIAIKEVAEELNLKPDQVKRISSLTYHGPKLASMIHQVSADPANRFRAERDRAIADLNNWTDTQLREALTEAQRQAIERMIGEPCTRRFYQYRTGCLP